MATPRNGLIAALDVGSSKVCCFIARADGQNLRVIGIGHQVSRGIRNGTVVDMEAAESAIRAAVDAAERMCGEHVREAFVSFAAGQPRSEEISVELPLDGRTVTQADVDQLVEFGRRQPVDPGRQVIHAMPIKFIIDNDAQRYSRFPLGLAGDTLGVRMHTITAAQGPYRNLAGAVARAHLGLAGFVLSPYASGLACLVPDEMDLGVALLDMGGGTTTISVFYEGSLVFADVIPVGGQHVTNDIARGLATSVADAERLKTLYGSVLSSHADDNEMLTVPQIGENDAPQGAQFARSHLIGIIKPRIEEIIELARDRLRQSGLEGKAGRRVVLTGGACQLQGLRDYAARLLDKQVRIGRPIRVTGLAEATGGPAFSACAGMLAYALQDRAEVADETDSFEAMPTGALARIGRWMRMNF